MKIEHLPKIYNVLINNGIVLLPFDVGYALISATKSALKKIVQIKRRPPGRPGVVLGDKIILKELISTKGAAHFVDFPFPIGLIGKIRSTKMAKKLPEELILKNKVGVFINMSNLGDAIAEYMWKRDVLVYGSSANISNRGNHYLLRDVEEEIKKCSDLIISGGKTIYKAIDPTTHKNLGSTIFDLSNRKIIRKGILFDEIIRELKRRKLL